MYQTCRFFQHYELQRKKYFGNNVLRKPVRLDAFAVRKLGIDSNEVVDNPEDFCFRYSLDKAKLAEQQLDLKVDWEEKLEKEEDVLKLNGELNVFLERILKNKAKYLNEPVSGRSAQPNSESAPADDLMGRMNNMRLDQPCEKLLATDFVALRATLALLLNCQYDASKTFTILAESFRGTIYLQQERDHENLDELVAHVSARKKFEMYCGKQFGEKPTDGESGTDESISDEKGEFRRRATHRLCFIFKNQMNQHRLLYSAAMGLFQQEFSLNDEPGSNEIGHVECKTSKEIVTNKQMDTFRRFKTLRYWSHGVLSDTQMVSVAFWRDNFMAFEVKEYSMDELTREGDWKADACLYQFNNILSFIKKSFRDNKHTNLLKFHHEGLSRKLVCEASDQVVLPDYYKIELSASA